MVAIHDYRNDSDGSVDDTAPNNSSNYSNSNSDSSNASTSSWRGWKERGKIAYLRGDYASALQNYLQAVQRQHNSFGANSNSNSNSSVRDFSFPSRLDQQILLSNTVACRLKLGGAPQAEAAVVTAKKCIAINRKWAKGHFRLAEAYLSLARSYEDKTESTQDQFSKSTNTNADPKSASQKRLECSNKACDALQMVIHLDPGNQSARNLLTKELRYLAVGSENSSSSNGGVNGAPEPSAPPEHMDENNNSNTSNNNTSDNSNQEPSSRSNTNNNDNNNIDINININNDSSNTGNDIDIEEDDHYDYTPSWQDRLSFMAYRIRAWYLGLCEDDKMVVKLAMLFVVLYVAFGGRFGLEYYGNNHRGSPPRRSNDVYEDFYKSRNQNLNYHSRDNYYPRGHQSSSPSPSPSPSSAFGGFYSYIMVLGAAAFISQRFFGISPYQAIFLVTTLMGRRGGRVYPRRRHDGFGRNYNFRHRRGGMWGR